MLEKTLRQYENNEITIDQLVRRYGNVSLELLDYTRTNMDIKDIQKIVSELYGKTKDERLITFKQLFYRAVFNNKDYIFTKDTIAFKEARLIFSKDGIKELIIKKIPKTEVKKNAKKN